MARSLNLVQLIGNLGQDPEMRYTAAGVPVASLSMATSESWKDQDGNQQDRTEWHSLVLWRKLAEIAAEYLKKGDKIYIAGRLRTRSWEDKESGQKRYKTEIEVQDLIMLGSPNRQGNAQSPKTEQTDLVLPGTDKKKEGDDDLPF